MAELVLISPNCLDLKVKGVEVELKKFPDGESYVRIPARVEGKRVAVVHRCYPNQDEGLLQLFLIVSQLREMKAKKIVCAIPYFPYARQDKRVKEGEAASAETVCRLLKACGCSKVITFDCHFLKKKGTFDYAGLKINNLSMARELIEKAKEEVSDAIIVSPDVGASYMSGGKKMEKKRGDYSKSGKTAYRDIVELSVDFAARGKNVVIIDDMISTGSTMIKAVETLKKAGAAKIVCCATHGLFLNSSLNKLFSAGAASVIVSDSIQSDASKASVAEKLRKLL